MIFAKALKYEDIIKNLDRENDVISMLGCETCVRVAGCGGRKAMKELALKLREDGFNVKEGFLVPTACNPKITFAKLDKEINTVVSMACSAGGSNIKRLFPECKLIESSEDVGLMVSDTDKKVLKITKPFKKFEHETGFEYETLTGIKLESNDNLPIMNNNKKEPVLEAAR
ncbi:MULTISPECIES: hypothetical protein [unclassified Oceanispirochaeta]|uniref:hypothetical protein n=1 Tax=unclassified Oceanispirochaeta TaxID=2635722 RepID=UPI000E098A82|nr:MULTISPECIES: hypothetical protein [unclassified Oceanispirochaeta]MBF9018399.1 hypothetical protein [Oceanispirochaeta sp. M2]NPD75211.1 hypothetical protein [Oceanispirochaeta sp. M1]RDG28928.1 hypothetical protein DV872_24250 [Oceanispirochaeta sp. M1]